MTASHTDNRRLLDDYRHALYEGDLAAATVASKNLFSAQAVIQLGYPFANLTGGEALVLEAILPLQTAIPDIERRDLIVMAGPTHHDTDWVGCCGYYTGTFAMPWLEIPPTGHQVSLRFHEFYRVVEGKVVELQAVWDIRSSCSRQVFGRLLRAWVGSGMCRGPPPKTAYLPSPGTQRRQRQVGR